jgi:hypothetical protein
MSLEYTAQRDLAGRVWSRSVEGGACRRAARRLPVHWSAALRSLRHGFAFLSWPRLTLVSDGQAVVSSGEGVPVTAESVTAQRGTVNASHHAGTGGVQ